MALVPLLEIDPTSFNLFVSREEALSESYLLFEKKKKKRIHWKTKFAGFFYWNFFHSLLISLLRGNSEFSYCRRYLWSNIRGKKNKFTALWRDGRKLFFFNVARWELSRGWLILYLSPDTIQPNFKIILKSYKFLITKWSSLIRWGLF